MQPDLIDRCFMKFKLVNKLVKHRAYAVCSPSTFNSFNSDPNTLYNAETLQNETQNTKSGTWIAVVLESSKCILVLRVYAELGISDDEICMNVPVKYPEEHRVIVKNLGVLDDVKEESLQADVHVGRWMYEELPWKSYLYVCQDSLSMDDDSLQDTPLISIQSMQPEFIRWIVLFPCMYKTRAGSNQIGFMYQCVHSSNLDWLVQAASWTWRPTVHFDADSIYPVKSKVQSSVQSVFSKVDDFISTALDPSALDAFVTLGLTPPKGLLLSGSKRSGYKQLVESIARARGIPIAVLSMGPALLQVQQLVMQDIPDATSDYIQAWLISLDLQMPILLFIPDLDVLSDTDEFADAIHLLVQSLHSPLPRNVFLIGFTNDSSKLPSLIRAQVGTNVTNAQGLFTHELPIPPLTAAEREAILTHALQDLFESPAQLKQYAASTALQMPGMEHDQVYSFTKNLTDVESTQFALRITPSGKTTEQGAFKLLDKKPHIIAGRDALQHRLANLIMTPILNPERFTRLGVEPPSGVLLYGPAGVGKREMLHWLASTQPAKVNLLTISASQIYSKYLGESEGNLRRVFQQAKSLVPCILHFESIEQVATRRGLNQEGTGVEQRLLSTFLNEMDGVTGRNSVGVICVGTTTRPDELDDALLRPGRLDHLVYMALPSEAEREAIQSSLGCLVSTETRGWSGAEVVMASQGFASAKKVQALRQYADTDSITACQDFANLH